ncbi:hypothetical protein [Caldimonas sp. KR1-144]|uniref:hypothetical protein n=1 Tax=Caldimonas sp. KR1-144 TaxID=3400911 RepID=UPI003BFE4CD7
MPLTKVTAAVLICVGLVPGLALGALSGQLWGLSQGKQLQRGKEAEQHVRDLNAIIDSHTGLITQAADASAALRLAMNRRAAADAESTEELKRALNSDAARRADCLFSADVMRQLAEARARAAAAAAGGIAGGMPTGPAGAGERSGR